MQLSGWTDVKWHCPICKKPTDSDTHPDFPFCCERCRLFDLGNWAAERYAVSEPILDEPVPDQSDSSNPDEPKD